MRPSRAQRGPRPSHSGSGHTPTARRLANVAVAAYARQAQDRQLILHATEIKLCAERRTGELLLETAQNGARRADPQENGHFASRSAARGR